MEREIFRRIIIEGQELLGNIELFERPFFFEERGNYVFVGIRQSGKSYLLYQRIQQLVKAGHSIEEIIYVNFDDERIKSVRIADLDLILQAYASMFDFKPIIFLDEIQNIDSWANFARRLVNQKYRVYITGSNAKMLSRDIATTLGGRFFCQNVSP
ncbi:MAG: AAA family ATPase, partial [Bacteroidales bacterium]|nr:AAA family ATPase [Bacteroidales bacterium]